MLAKYLMAYVTYLAYNIWKFVKLTYTALYTNMYGKFSCEGLRSVIQMLSNSSFHFLKLQAGLQKSKETL